LLVTRRQVFVHEGHNDGDEIAEGRDRVGGFVVVVGPASSSGGHVPNAQEVMDGIDARLVETSDAQPEDEPSA
jgi:hypothetical protein